MQKVLLIEDNPEVQIMVRGSLGKNYSLFVAGTFAEASTYINDHSFELMVVDIGLPDGNGFDFCSKVKTVDKTKNIPFIFLTGKTDTKDKVLGFSLGADDYVVKPFDPMELRARAESKIKKMQERVVSTGSLHKGMIRIEVSLQKAFLAESQGDKELDLTPSEFKLLNYFALHEGQLLSRSHLLQALWGTSTNVVDRTVDTHICTLRKKLVTDSVRIESVFGEGYKFVANPSVVV